jgi:hypothetical protein
LIGDGLSPTTSAIRVGEAGTGADCGAQFQQKLK